MCYHGKRDANPDFTVCVMASRKFTINNILGMRYNSGFFLAFQRLNLAVMMVRRSMPIVDSELFSLRRWPLFSELSFLTRLVVQLALSRTKIQALMR